VSRPDRALARRDPATGAWFDALRDGRLLLRACPDGHLSRPDVLVCDVCGAMDLGWQPTGGRGVVVCLAVDHATEPTTRLAVVELAEGPWLLTRVEGAPVERGAEVTVEILHPVEGESYPVVSAD
jgi:uncharacterized protein